MPHLFVPRRLRKEFSRKTAKVIRDEMKTNLMHLVKPRPQWIPKIVWVFLLKLFLNLPKKNV